MPGEGGDRGDVDDAAGSCAGASAARPRRSAPPAPRRLTVRISLLVRLGNRAVRIAVEHAGVVDQDVDLAEQLDQRGDAGEVRAGRRRRARRRLRAGNVLVQREDAQAALAEAPSRSPADAARGAGDQRRSSRRPGPGIEKPVAFSSVIKVSSCEAVSSTSGGRQVFHCGSLPKCAIAAFSAGIIGCFCTILRVAVMPACSLSASGARQLR